MNKDTNKKFDFENITLEEINHIYISTSLYFYKLQELKDEENLEDLENKVFEITQKRREERKKDYEFTEYNPDELILIKKYFKALEETAFRINDILECTDKIIEKED